MNVAMIPSKYSRARSTPKTSSQSGRLHVPFDSTELEKYLYITESQCVPEKLKLEILNGCAADYPYVFYRGNLDVLNEKSVSVVGTRSPTEEGKQRTAAVCRYLIQGGYVIVSGLAKGIDTVAHTSAVANGRPTIAVLGTPIHKIYPAENKNLAEQISSSGLLLSSALPHEETGKYLFPRRNRLMARISIATVIIEAGETSGVVHQASECLRQKRKLIFLRSLADRNDIEWVGKFINSGAIVAENGEHLLEIIK